MIIGSIVENNQYETRTALTPDVVQKLTSLGHTVIIEKNLGIKSFFSNKSYKEKGATFLLPSEILKRADILLQINPPLPKYLKFLTSKQLLISNFQNFNFQTTPINSTSILLEKLPRISVAQSIDILSSQSTVRGYIASIYCLAHSPLISPQLMTASTSTKPARALVLGASTTGLQSASTFKRNGCIVTILDINKENKSLASSVGASLEIASTKSSLYNLLSQTNFIVGSASSHTNTPQIISKQDLKVLPQGCVIVDTTSQNISLSASKKTTQNYIFYRNQNIERLCPQTSSTFWSHNMLNLISLISPNINSINLNIPYLTPMIKNPNSNISGD